MDKAALKQEIASLLDQQIQCVLATIDDRQPCQHMMAFACSEDLSRIYLATYKDTRKFRNMMSNPRVSILWDNRRGSANDHVEGLSLIALGQAELLDGLSEVEIRQSLLARNPALGQLLEDSSCQLFVVRVDSYQWTRGYQLVLNYSFEQGPPRG